MSVPDTTGTGILVGSAYRDDRHLAARQGLYRWQQPSYDLPGLVLDHLPVGSGVVLDLGCGNGRYLDRIRAARPNLTVIGLDISAGILAAVARPVVVADAACLPVADRSASAVLAMHMLHHARDVDAVLAEAVRVLVPGGTVVASTNARADKQELDELWAAAAAVVMGVEQGPRRISLSDRFALDDAPVMLRRHFVEVEVIDLSGTIAVTEPDPVIAHLASYCAWADAAGAPFDGEARRMVEQTIECHRQFRITCRAGVLVGRTPL
ncbi:MAG: class I SAM-dependent methyltransferase [Nocardioides sp.]